MIGALHVLRGNSSDERQLVLISATLALIKLLVPSFFQGNF
jgi:hypothetical protein